MEMTPEYKQKLLLARLSATPKSTYTTAILSFCRHCIGHNYTISCSNNLCRLYPYRTLNLTQKAKKTSIKKDIQHHCIECLGLSKKPIDYAVCSSHSCHLYPHRYSKHE